MSDRTHARHGTAWVSRPDPDALARVVGRGLLLDADAPAWRDARFVDWLAAQARAGETPPTDEEFVALGAAARARVEARRLHVSRCDGTPTLREAPLEHERAVPLVQLGVAAGDGRELWDEPPQHWVTLPDVVPSGDYLAFRIVGDSMTPLMHTGDTVLVQLGAPLRRDTVVVARHPDDGYLCKRVHRVGRRTIELASLEPGRGIVTIPRDARYVLGAVLMVWCAHAR
jgi:SOS-response transcriptional repressor LexA